MWNLLSLPAVILHGVKGEAWEKNVTIVKMSRTSQQYSAQPDRQPIITDFQHI